MSTAVTKRQKKKGSYTASYRKPLPDPRQEKFCREYSRHGHGERAIVAAGYDCKTWEQDGSRSAMVQASVMLKRPNILYRIQWLQENRARSADLTEVRLLRELKHISFFRAKSVYYADGRLKPVQEWPEEAQAAVSSIETEKLYGLNDDGKRDEIGTVVKVRFHSKLDAIKELMKYFGMNGSVPDSGVNFKFEGNNQVNFYLPENPRHAKIINGQSSTSADTQPKQIEGTVIELPPKSNGSH